MTATEMRSAYAPFNSGGVRGNITFAAHPSGLTISVHLVSVTPSSPQQFEWVVNEFPVFYDLKNPCSANELGKVVHDLSRKHGPILIPTEDQQIQTFVDPDLTLEGTATLWGKSITLRNRNNKEQRSCSNLMTTGRVKTFLATFTETVAGTVLFRENEEGQTSVFSNLFFTGEEYKTVSRNEWKILVTDILDTKRDRKCDYLQTLLDPNDTEDSECSQTEHKKCKTGDLSRKHGHVVIGSNNNRYSKKASVDLNLGLAGFGSSRALYLTIYDKSGKRVLTCAQIQEVDAKEVKAVFSMDGVKGLMHFSQSFRTEPTVVTVILENLLGRAKWYHIHEWPLPPRLTNDQPCSAEAVGGHHNPFGINATTGPAAGVGSNDQYEVGDLSGKYGPLSEDQSASRFVGIYVDMNLPLFGVHSIVGRSVLVHKGDGQRWICANIGYPGPVVTAVATFVYPVVGHVVFRQQKDKPWSETTVFAELSFSDGSLNNSFGHNWHIHAEAHNRDFYNWSRRCDSAGDLFNPFAVGLGRNYVNLCNEDNQMRCRVGDLSAKSKKLTVAAFKGSVHHKLFYTDTVVPLSGAHWQSVIGRSVVVLDDSAPQQRGNRLACAVIRTQHPLTAAVRTWRTSSGVASNISGALVLHQETQLEPTKTHVELHGLNGLASGYHIHKVSEARRRALTLSRRCGFPSTRSSPVPATPSTDTSTPTEWTWPSVRSPKSALSTSTRSAT